MGGRGGHSVSTRVLTRLSILSCLLIKRITKGRGGGGRGGRGRGSGTPESSCALGWHRVEPSFLPTAIQFIQFSKHNSGKIMVGAPNHLLHLSL